MNVNEKEKLAIFSDETIRTITYCSTYRAEQMKSCEMHQDVNTGQWYIGDLTGEEVESIIDSHIHERKMKMRVIGSVKPYRYFYFLEELEALPSDHFLNLEYKDIKELIEI